MQRKTSEFEVEYSTFSKIIVILDFVENLIVYKAFYFSPKGDKRFVFTIY